MGHVPYDPLQKMDVGFFVMESEYHNLFIKHHYWSKTWVRIDWGFKYNKDTSIRRIV